MQADGDLLLAWRGGDASAGEELFARYFHTLNRSFRGKTSRDSGDLAQQTFLACVEGRDRVRDGTAFRAYLYTVARRILRRELELRHRTGPLDPSVTSVHDIDADVEAAHAEREDERLLLWGLRRIPLDYQIALELRFWEQMRGPELAVALDLPEGTVRTRIRRGLQLLRQELERIEADPTALSSTLTRIDAWAAEVRDAAGLGGG